MEHAGNVVDWAKFARMRTQLGADFIRILGYFREDGEKSVGRIEEAMHRRDAAALIIPAHTMKTEANRESFPVPIPAPDQPGVLGAGLDPVEHALLIDFDPRVISDEGVRKVAEKLAYVKG